MKKWKGLTMGFVAGVACMLTTTAIAETGKTVSAFVSGDTTFKINGENMAQDPNLPVLNYNGYIYVPTRFIAEKLECEINWDPVLRQVVINAPEPEVVEKVVEVPVEKIVYVDKDEAPGGNKVYSSLPMNRKTEQYTLDITGMTRVVANEEVRRASDITKVFVSLENKGQYNLQLVHTQAKLTVDGKEYPVTSMRSYWDDRWYNDIMPDDIVEGYLAFDLIPEDYENCTLTFQIRKNGSTEEPETVEFNFRR